MRWWLRTLSPLLAATLVVLAILAVLLVAAQFVHAEPPAHADPALHDFFESQKIPGTPGGISCCSVADGRVVDYRIRDGHYEVFLTAESFPWVDPTHLGWRPVDDRSVLQGKENPIGKAVAWVAHADYGGGIAWGTRSFKKDDVMCLLLPALT